MLLLRLVPAERVVPRGVTALRRCCYSTTSGKKIKPEKPNIVVLNPKQAGIAARNRDPRKLPHSSHHLSILQGVDLGADNSKTSVHRRQPSRDGDAATEENADYLSLLNFQSKITPEQIVSSIDSLKPPQTSVSNATVQSLTQNLYDSYTAKQLQYFLKSKDPNMQRSRLNKGIMINKILLQIWGLKIMDSLTTTKFRQIKMSRRSAKLLILTQNGKILQNLIRLNKNLLIQLNFSTNDLNIWCDDESLIRFIEISISQILRNVVITSWDLGTLTPDLMALITKTCAVDIDLATNECAAFGWKRINLAKRLFKWVQAASLEKKVMFENERIQKWTSENREVHTESFFFNDIGSLNWFRRNYNDWTRLQEVAPFTETEKTPSAESFVDDEKINELHDFLYSKRTPPTAAPFELVNDASQSPTHHSLISVSLGQLLTRSKTAETFFLPRVPHLVSKLMKLPLYDDFKTKDAMFTVEQHDYYLQLQFAPAIENPDLPPLEIWLELDDNDDIILESAQCLVQEQKSNYLIQTPELCHDYKVSMETVSNVSLETQNMVKTYLKNLKFTSLNHFKCSHQLSVAAPDGKNAIYDYLAVNYHRIIKLRYMDKYVVQFSDINGGSLGGRYSQVHFVCDENPTRDQFSTFIKDVFKFN
ncbi:Sls1p KNAG_0A02900 [Huiozyma naganishii CBS 8797]|uniref:Uncharacterized protein n=1 Tax=Huiozyma naganishii (strain ATCC MYA-139 / BCRC 22969 / CBS 8797 / KCTC 17520 / NBRC 10181 / NCYC 3082 / Yp74L-3) TaxID=1071383 RepID=J7S262_HUIN7|nr:hypothetical protein KNAG_0A02900 [Kazachstania naganishii CBS 8797]CCK67979.1 hypothetical protein KNAG_0A02900 [Kazachstania naganishii CBS 8797]